MVDPFTLQPGMKVRFSPDQLLQWGSSLRVTRAIEAAGHVVTVAEIEVDTAHPKQSQVWITCPGLPYDPGMWAWITRFEPLEEEFRFVVTKVGADG